MNYSDLLQQFVIAVIVLFSALHVLRRLLPKWTRARQTALATWLGRPQRPAMLRVMGRWLQPAETSGGGCGSGCSTCATCESNPEADAGKTHDVDAKPLTFHRHT